MRDGLLIFLYSRIMLSLPVVILAEPCGSFFSFASFQVRAKTKQRASLAGADFVSIDVYRAR